MTDRAPPSRTAISKGRSKTSATSRGPAWTGARLRPDCDAEYDKKCLAVAMMPADSTPAMYAAPNVPTTYGSSPIVSSTRPQRASRTTSTTGARPWWTPSPAIVAPISAPIRRTSAGSNVAAQASGVG